MRRAIAALLLACLGILLPLAATPVRLCLLEHRLLMPGVSECESKKSSCCPDCGEHHEVPCCVDLEDLPDAPAPSVPEGLPAVVAIDLPPPVFVLPPVTLVECSIFEAAVPIRGPDSPAAWRALFEVWRL
ncbi:hypothetical protein OKA05_12010 [Luteolibacter arcticus]|uniref:DUF2946 domain-containing protein n=1 Tax=Luteolibacter arcticus TaxID=1581411 RepID=A0ABT3GIE0_9BACT|nr:hypothetical protein [Luteolibacter arcticus]MCW1923280.1 hypothetical protein [Luteolibacter arcticus]